MKSRVAASAISRSAALRMLMHRAAPLLRVPRVRAIDDFALKRRRRYACAVHRAAQQSGVG